MVLCGQGLPFVQECVQTFLSSLEFPVQLADPFPLLIYAGRGQIVFQSGQHGFKLGDSLLGANKRLISADLLD